MSLIEAAVQKAKKLADTQTPRTPAPERTPTQAPAKRRVLEPDSATVAARAAMARPVPVAPADPQVMERSNVLPQVSDAAAQRAYRILRTRVQQRMQAMGWTSVAVTAAGAGEGKTLTCINLAIALARDVNTWVYLVDLDLQRPKIASYLGMQFSKGLSEYLSGQAQFDEILYSPGEERLAVIPNAHAYDYSSDVLGSPRVRELCQSLAAENPRPIVIYDMPPLLLSDDVIKFSPNFDCTLLVVSEGVTSRASLKRAQEALHEMNLLGVVLNRSAEREDSHYY